MNDHVNSCQMIQCIVHVPYGVLQGNSSILRLLFCLRAGSGRMNCPGSTLFFQGPPSLPGRGAAQGGGQAAGTGSCFGRAPSPLPPGGWSHGTCADCGSPAPGTFSQMCACRCGMYGRGPECRTAGCVCHGQMWVRSGKRVLVVARPTTQRSCL